MEYGEVKIWQKWGQKGEPSLNQSDKSSPPAAWFWLFHWRGKKFRGNWSGSFLQDTLLRSPALLCYESLVVHDLLPEKKNTPATFLATHPSSQPFELDHSWRHRLSLTSRCLSPCWSTTARGPTCCSPCRRRSSTAMGEMDRQSWTWRIHVDLYIFHCKSSSVLPVECTHGLQCKFVIIFLKITLQLMNWLIDYLPHI